MLTNYLVYCMIFLLKQVLVLENYSKLITSDNNQKIQKSNKSNQNCHVTPVPVYEKFQTDPRS